jgi:hypothetical protein
LPLADWLNIRLAPLYAAQGGVDQADIEPGPDPITKNFPQEIERNLKRQATFYV